jgi:hypothetical protein
MKHALFVIGIILSLFGLIVIAGTTLDMVDPAAKYSISEYAIAMAVFGIVPLAGGIALCVFHARKRRRAKLQQQKCGKCNSSLEPGWKACPHCGEKVSSTN